jgi:HlyD family secretion protein
MHIRRTIIVLAFLALIVPPSYLAIQANQAQGATTTRELEFYRVQRGDVQLTVNAIGTIEADETVNLSFTAGGRVAELLVQQGDYVLAGDVIARLENTPQQIAFEQAQIAVDMARLRKADLLAGPDSGQIAVAQANVDAAWGAYTSLQRGTSADDIRAAELRVAQADQAAAAAQEARTTAQGGQPEQSYVLLDAQIGQAQFNAEIARLQLEALRTGSSGQLGAAYARIGQAQAQLDQLLAGPVQSQVDTSDAAIAQAEAGLDQAAAALARAQITAPFDGVLSSLLIEVGALVTPGLPIAEITDVAPLRLSVNIDEIDLRDVAVGMPARVEIDALDDVELPAVLEQIALVGVNQGGIVSYPSRMLLQEPIDPRVRVGMTAEAKMVVDEQLSTLLVPNDYVRLDRQRDLAFVNIVTPEGTLEEIEITLGLQGEDFSEVIAGLDENDVIAVELGGDAISGFGG